MSLSFDPYKEWNLKTNPDAKQAGEIQDVSFLNLRRFAADCPRPAPSFFRQFNDKEIILEAKDPLTIKLFEYLLKNPSVRMDATTLSEWFQALEIMPDTRPTCPFGVVKRLRILSIYRLVKETPSDSGNFVLDRNVLRKDLHPEVLDFYKRTCDKLGLAEVYRETRGKRENLRFEKNSNWFQPVLITNPRASHRKK